MKNIFEDAGDERIYRYDAYRALFKQLVAEQKTTGPKQSPEYADYTRLNWIRMQRVEKTAVINEELMRLVAEINVRQFWYVITEAWCGDAAQCLPVLAKLADMNPLIELRILLRDENPLIMDAYTTNGSRSIPKLVVLNLEGKEIFTWGPRPEGAQATVEEHNRLRTKSSQALAEEIQKWYNHDQTASLQREIMRLLNKG